MIVNIKMCPATSLTVHLQVLLLISLSLLVVAADDDTINRVYSDVDESSCICGLNKVILDRLESIVKTSNIEHCQTSHPSPPGLQTIDTTQSSGSPSEVPNSLPSITLSNDKTSNLSLDNSDIDVQQRPEHHGDISNDQETSHSGNSKINNDGHGYGDSIVNRLTDEIHTLQSQLAQLVSYSRPGQESSSSWSMLPTQPSTSYDRPSYQVSNLSSDMKTGENDNEGKENAGSSVINNDFEDDGVNIKQPINSGFLNGLPSSAIHPPNGAWNNLNETHKVDTADIQNALELTIPNVVSNIFSNIQNLTIQTEHHKNGNSLDHSQNLTSIDGSSVNVSGSSTAQITAQGEQLFLQWIDHQLQSLHITVSVADYIRKNALSLFRRIVRQYVERVEKMGGRVEDNVRRATQVALNNTQNLISFLLKNYLYFAGGLIRIIGEQVSRIGKQIDSTGGTIAKINLNPFDIVSNVIESLPNPSRYSEYFRAVGKYLMGESSPSNSTSGQPEQQTSDNNSQHQETQRPKGGLFSKTMGALSKTLGSWIG